MLLRKSLLIFYKFYTILQKFYKSVWSFLSVVFYSYIHFLHILQVFDRGILYTREADRDTSIKNL